MDKEYVDILTGENLSSYKVANIDLMVTSFIEWGGWGVSLF